MSDRFKVILASGLAVIVGWSTTALFVKGGRELAIHIPEYSTATLIYEARASAGDYSPRTYYLRADAPSPPELKARSYIVADLLTGDVLIQKNPDKPYPIASVSKLITALTAIDMYLSDTDLLYPLLLESSNPAADEIAKQLGGRQFVDAMNDYVKSIGATHTYFADPSGISPRNMSSASDLLLIAKHIYKEKPEILELTLLTEKRDWRTNNLFVQERHPNYIGGKSGFTPEAKGTLLAIFALPLSDGELRPVVVILLGTDSERGVKYEVAQSIIDYILENVYFK